MDVLLHHVAFAGATVALAAAGLRVASVAPSGGLERWIAGAVLATAMAVLWALLLGLAGLGSSWVALTAAAAITWLAARRTVAAPAVSALGELRDLARASTLTRRVLAAAIVGFVLACAAFFLARPGPDIDTVAYHLPEAIAWVHSGHPGAVVQPAPAFQTGFYPLTNEVVLAWGMSIARSFAPVALWQPLILLLAAAAGWLGLRRLGVSPLATVVAIGAVLASPPFAVEVNTALNDDVALTWLIAAAALTAAAGRDRPRLLAIALVAGGLSIGCKATTAPLLALVFAIAAFRMRRREALPLAAGAVVAVGVGGVWYLRDLFLHGSPLWPEVALPGGDPMPPLLARMDVSFLQRPAVALHGRLPQYAHVLAGNVVLILGAIVAALASRRREVVVAGAACAVGLVLWASAPFTGVPRNRALDLSISATRYLLPVAATGAVALALATKRGGTVGRAALLALASAFVWSLLESASRPSPTLPSLPILGAGVAVGAIAVGALGRWLLRTRLALAAAGLLGSAALAAASGGYVQRSASTSSTFAAPVIRWLSTQSAFRNGSAPVAVAPQQVGLLAGDRLQHRVELIGLSEPCRRIRARALRGWVVVRFIDPRFFALLGPSPAQGCLADAHPVFAAGDFRVFRAQPRWADGPRAIP